MPKNNFKNFSYLLIAVFLTLGLSISFQTLLAAYTAPSGNPPACDPLLDAGCNQPTNVGSQAQSKGGPLTVNYDNIAATGFVALGNVGIGTLTPPATKLQVVGNNAGAPLLASNNSSIIIQNAYTIAANTGSALQFKSDTRGNNTFAAIAGNMLSATADGAYGDLVFGTKATEAATDPVERMRITSTGNVGIGLAAPSGKLEIQNGTDADGSRIRLDGQEIKIIDRYLSSDFTAKIWASWPGYGVLNFGVNDGAGGDVASPDLSIRGNGNVGIGTSSPAVQLELAGTGQWSPLRIGGTNATGAGLDLLPSSAYPGFSLWAGAGAYANKLFISRKTAIGSSAELVAIDNTGNVGIGTTSPSAKLVVVGQVKITGGTPGTGKVLASDASGLASWQAPASSQWVTSGSSVYYNTGNVGIGTSTPSQKLDVRGNILTTGGLYSYGGSISTQNIINYDYDGLFMANKKWTVSTVGFASSDNMFDAKPETSVTCSTLPCSVTIDFGGPQHYWYAFSLSYPWGTTYAGSSSFLIEKYYDSDSSNGWACTGADVVWSPVADVTGFSGYRYLNTSITNGLCQLRITFRDIVGSQAAIQLGEFAAYRYYYGNEGPNLSRAGDTVFGGLNFSGVSSDITTPSGQNLSLMPGGTGNVGIGTVSPGAKLEVNGSGNQTVDLKINGRIQTGDANNAGGIWLDSANTMFVGQQGAGGIGLWGNGIGWGLVMNKATGNVGVGTLNPKTQLDIAGNFQINSNLNASNSWQRFSLGYGAYWNNTDLNYTITDQVNNQATFSDENGSFVWTSHGGALTTPQTYAQWHAFDRMVITSAGDVGIGTAAPAYKLDVAGDINFTGTLRQNGAAFAGGGQWTTNGTNIYNANTGNVGIGTASPGTKLDVNGNIYMSATNPYGGVNVYNAQKEQNVSAASVAGAGWYRVAHIDAQAGRGQNTVTVYTIGGSYAPRSTTIRWFHDWATTAGITAISEIGSAAGYWTDARVTDDGANSYLEINFTQAVSNFNLSLQYDGGFTRGALYDGALLAGGGTVRAIAKLGLLTVGTDKLLVDNNGNVGIGTAAPNSLLHLYKNVSGTNAEIAIQSGNGTIVQDKWSLYQDQAGGGMRFWNTNVPGDKNALTIQENGNVGIGTVAPNNLIQVANLINFNNPIFGTFLGYKAGSVTTGNFNTFVGHLSGQANTSGNDNSAVGSYAMYNNITGGSNSALGYVALSSNTTGESNVAIGTAALFSVTAGSNNTALGTYAGWETNTIDYGSQHILNSTSNNSIYLGAKARGMNNGDDNEIVIGYDAAGVGNNSVVLGNSSIAKTILNGNVGIGTAAPGAKLEIFTGNGTSGLKTGLICSDANTSKLYTDASGNIICGVDQTGGGSGNIVDTLAATLGASNDAGGLNMVNLGRVGIGTAAAGARLNLGQLPAFTEGLRIIIGATDPWSPINIAMASGTTAFKVDQNSDTYIGRDLIVGNNFYINAGGDVAEEFATDEDYPAGTVLVMADKGYKSVRASDRPYDNTVIGVVSDNPAIVMGRIKSEKKAVVAMVGVIKVKVAAVNGQVSKGDLLTTSAVPGYAMKATEGKLGTIIGKALENLKGERGEIMVLINLR